LEEGTATVGVGGTTEMEGLGTESSAVGVSVEYGMARKRVGLGTSTIGESGTTECTCTSER